MVDWLRTSLIDCAHEPARAPAARPRRTTWLLQTIVGNNKPCLLVGESGTAKSVTISNYLGSLDAQVGIG